MKNSEDSSLDSMVSSSRVFERVRPSQGFGGEMDSDVWERISRAMNFEEADRVPIWDYLDNRGIVEHLGQPGDDYAQGMVRVYHTLGIDLCRGYGGSFKEEQEGEWTGEGRVRHRISGRTQWKMGYEIQSLGELKSYALDPVSLDWIRQQWVPAIREQQRRFAPRTFYVPGHGMGFHGTYALMGLQFFSYALYDAPGEIERLLESNGENAHRFARVAAEERLGPIYFIGDDIAYKDKLMFSLSFLRRTFIPMLRRCIEPLHQHGIKVVYHSDGNLWEILDDMIEAGIDGLNPIEPLAGMTLNALKRRYGRRLLLVGGMDCSQLLPLGTPDDIRDAVKEAMRAAAPGGGLFIGSSSEIVPSTPVRNILAFYQACREYGRYPVRGIDTPADLIDRTKR